MRTKQEIFEHCKKRLKGTAEATTPQKLRFIVIEYLCYFPNIDPYKMAAELRKEGYTIIFDNSSISRAENKAKENKLNRYGKETPNTGKCYIDMWYDNWGKFDEITKIDITFYPNDSKYRGNIYVGQKIVGDYTATSSQAIEKAFPHLVFNWG